MYYSRWWKISAVGLSLWLTAAPGHAQQSAATKSSTEEKARSTLMKAAEFLAKAQRFSVKADISTMSSRTGAKSWSLGRVA